MTAVGSKGRTQGVVCSGCAWWVQTSNTLFSAYSSCLHLNRGTTNKSKMPNQLPASMTPSYTSHTTSQLRHSNLLFLLEEGFLPPCCFSCFFPPPSLRIRAARATSMQCWSEHAGGFHRCQAGAGTGLQQFRTEQSKQHMESPC